MEVNKKRPLWHAGDFQPQKPRHGGRTMSIAIWEESHKSDSIVDLSGGLEAYVQEAAADGKPLHEVERKVWDRVLQIGRCAMEDLIRLQGDGDLGEVVSTAEGGKLHRSEEPVDRPLRTIFGTHTIHAYVYAPGSKRAIELRPVDARLGLPKGRCSYLFEEFAQLFCVEQAFGQASEVIETVFGQQVSQDTLERISQRMGPQADRFLDQLPTPSPAQEGELLVFTGDCKGVPLVRADARQLALFDSPDRPGNRRMAALAAVYSVDRYKRTPDEVVAALFRDDSQRRWDRPQPRFKHVVARFGRTYDEDGKAMSSSGPLEAFSWAGQQVAARRQPGQMLIRMIDGQSSLWDTADLCLEVGPKETVDILDILHVSSYVWRAAKLFHSHREHQEAFARDRLLRILNGETHSVVTGIRQMAGRRKLKGKDRKEIATVCGYFKKNAHRMRYDLYLREGYPIATGVIEGACRHLVKDRMERSGMRWTLQGAQAMLNVRAVHQSSYWDQFHRHRFKEQQEKLHPHRDLLCEVPRESIAA